jgi:predicted Zn-dependent peptidase
MIKRKILDNGMTVIFKERKNDVVSVAFAVRQGGRNEFSRDKGISHFIEHMLYKGTPTRNTQQIATELEKNGGEMNGFTAEQVTAYWCKMPAKHLDIALEVLGDMVRNPLFDGKELDKERQVIFEEMKMYQDNPRMHVFDKIKSLMYEGDFSDSIIGTKESMMGNDKKKLQEFFDRIYVPENMILAVTGDADFDDVCKFAEKNFSKTSGKLEVPEIKLRNGQEVEKRKGIDQANVVFGYHAPLPNDDKFYAAHILSVLMAGGLSSRLFSEIREKRNLAYAVKGVTEAEVDFSYNIIYIGTTPENVDKVKDLILKEFEKVHKTLEEDELNQVKEQIIGNHLISQEDSHNILMDMLTEELRGDATKVEGFVKRVKDVKLEDVKALAGIKEYSFFALVPE